MFNQIGNLTQNKVVELNKASYVGLMRLSASSWLNMRQSQWRRGSSPILVVAPTRLELLRGNFYLEIVKNDDRTYIDGPSYTLSRRTNSLTMFDTEV